MSVATDLKNAGGIYEDKSVVVDGNLVTPRFPADLPDFCREILKLLQIKEK
jgi:protease I